jgi:hypothetical protein
MPLLKQENEFQTPVTVIITSSSRQTKSLIITSFLVVNLDNIIFYLSVKSTHFVNKVLLAKLMGKIGPANLINFV